MSDREALSDPAVRGSKCRRAQDAIQNPQTQLIILRIVKFATKYSQSDAKLLECQRCKEHFCIKCLKKSNTEHDILSKSDTVWFCVKCRKIVEEHIKS